MRGWMLVTMNSKTVVTTACQCSCCCRRRFQRVMCYGLFSRPFLLMLMLALMLILVRVEKTVCFRHNTTFIKRFLLLVQRQIS